jgi:hypothetical protein
MDEQAVVERTRRWIATMVIGLNLCPFARRVFDAGTIRYAVTDTRDVAALLGVLASELAALTASAAFETTLLIHPRVLGAFGDYNDFLDDADRLVDDLGLRGTVQVASFHPDYRFAGTAPDAVENYTNRAPYPMLHLLREESVSAVAGDPDALLAIPRRNVEALRGLGIEKVRARLKAAEGGPRD